MFRLHHKLYLHFSPPNSLREDKKNLTFFSSSLVNSAVMGKEGSVSSNFASKGNFPFNFSRQS